MAVCTGGRYVGRGMAGIGCLVEVCLMTTGTGVR
jgi:hypothetical protein